MKNSAVLLLFVATCCGCGSSVGLADKEGVTSPKAEREPFEGPVPRAQCGPGDRAELLLQGQVPQAESQSGVGQGYKCNLELIGQEGSGAWVQQSWYGDCSYYAVGADYGNDRSDGVAVVDVADPANPTRITVLDTAAMIEPWESLKVTQQRGLLGATQFGGTAFEVWDVKDDCTAPKLIGTAELANGAQGHEGNWSADGRTYWAASQTNNLYCPFDVDDPANPQFMLCWPEPGITHGLSTNAAGTRGYFSKAGFTPPYTNSPLAPLNGLTIVDTSEVQARKPDPEMRIVSELVWADGNCSQMTQPVFFGGVPHLIFTDECDYGAARIIDISDETTPRVISKLKLEIHMPENRPIAVADGNTTVVNYDGHYCYADRTDDPDILVCGYVWSGLRVFDIRNPYAPREIAYYNPGLPSDPESGLPSIFGGLAQPRFIRDRGEIWYVDSRNGLNILRFTNGVWPLGSGSDVP